MSPFYTLSKKTLVYARKPWFSDIYRDMKWKHWLLAVVNIPLEMKASVANFPILYPLKTQKNQRFSEATILEHWPEMG